MEKKWLFIFLFAILIMNFVASSSLDDAGKKLENVEGTIGKLSDEDERSEFLKKKWTEFFENAQLKGILETIEKFFSFLNPIWENVLGRPFSFSWSFILTLMLALTFLIVLIRFALVFGDLAIPLNYSKYYNILSFILVLLLLSVSKFPLILSNWGIEMISSFDNLGIQLISIVVILFALAFVISISKQIKGDSSITREDRRIGKIEKKQDTQKREAKREIKKLEKKFEKEELEEDEFKRLVEEYKQLIPDYDIKKFLFKTKKIKYNT